MTNTKKSTLFSSKVKNVITSSTFLTALAASVFVVNTTPVQAATFQWEFSNIVGGKAGTVSGTLEVSEGNNVAATSVILKSTTNPIFDSIIGFDFVSLPNFANSFNVTGGKITAALFGNSYFSSSTNLSLELNAGVFGDPDSQNLGLLTIAGNPLPVSIGGDGVCPTQCLQTSELFGDNTGKTQFAPKFTAIPETSPVMGLLVTFGLLGVNQLRRRISVV